MRRRSPPRRISRGYSSSLRALRPPSRRAWGSRTMFFAYLYLLRVPLVAGMLLTVFAPFALAKGTQVTTLLEGMFDLNWWRVAIATLAALLAVSAGAITSLLVLRYGAERFGVRPLPSWSRSPVTKIQD